MRNAGCSRDNQFRKRGGEKAVAFRFLFSFSYATEARELHRKDAEDV